MRCHVKICGVTSIADAQTAAAFGADAIGLNFYARSPRGIDESTAREILAVLPTSASPVMLAVNEPWDATLARLARLPGVRSLQIHHADLTPRPASATIPWTPAFAVKDRDSLRTIEAFLARCRDEGAMPATILIDAHVPGSFGGTGQLAPWHLLADFDAGVPLILAGGLTADNVADAVRRVRPFMVDVASGVESSPGKKDLDQMKRFIDAVREAM